LIWVNILPHIPKCSRYTLGARIENKFLDLLETSYVTYYIGKDKKLEKISECILLLDTLKFLISVAWEGKVISNKHFEGISTKLNETGKMFGGWKKSLEIEQIKTAKSELAERISFEMRQQTDCRDSTDCQN